MERAFISNNKEVATKGFEVNKDFDAINLPVKTEHQDGNTVFVIDVHCTFKQAEKLQQQGGVIIYRHLLNKFKDCQDKLKVVFYSPIPKEDLVKLKPENYVLRLMPFVECKYEGKEQFEGELSAEIAKYEKEDWVQFNNASENLLSGWALMEQKEINLQGMNVLAIDDQFTEWSMTYNTIFTNYTLISPKYKSQRGFQDAWRNGNATDEIMKCLEKSSLILSDLYLYEPHESDIWKNPDYIKSISGYVTFEAVRNSKPAIPVIFHSSSNKIRNYKNLASLICDGYVVKDIRANSSASDKLNTYTEFQTAISETVNDFGHVWVHQLFDFLQSNNSSKWWVQRINNKYVSDKKKASETIKEFTDLLKYILLAYKQLLNQNTEFTKLFYSGAVINPYSFTVANIIQSCGRLDELMDGIHNAELEFLINLRHQAAHADNYHLYQANDAKIAVALLFKTLSENSNRPVKLGTFIQPKARQNKKGNLIEDKFKYYHQIFAYTSYYNNFYNYLDNHVLELFEKRLRYYAMLYYTERWKKYNAKEKNHIITSYPAFAIDNSITPAYEADTKSVKGKCTIKFKN